MKQSTALHHPEIPGKISVSKVCSMGAFLALLVLPMASASAQLISYTDGSKVNLLNAWDATLTVSGTPDAFSSLTANQARFNIESAGGEQLGRVTTSNPVATLDLGSTQNIKTITTYCSFANYGFSAATVETSDDGIIWTSRSNVVTNPSSTTNTVVTLDSSVNARYVRVTPTSFQNGGGGDNRWLINTMRAFGDTGALAGTTNLTIVANGGLSAAQSITGIGTISQINTAQMLNPSLSPLSRELIYNMGNGEGFQLDLGQTFTVDRGTINLTSITASLANPLVMTLSGSLDGVSFTDLYTKTYTSNVTSFDLFNYSFDATAARYLNLVFTTAVDTDIRVSDFAFFQTNPVQAPQTWTLVGLGACAVLFRLRCKQRAA